MTQWDTNQFNARVAQDTQYSNTVIKAAVSGQTHVVTDIHIVNGATARTYSILDGSGGTVLFQYYLAANTAVGSSIFASFKTPLKFTSGNGVYCTSSGASTGAIVIVNGYMSVV